MAQPKFGAHGRQALFDIGVQDLKDSRSINMSGPFNMSRLRLSPKYGPLRSRNPDRD